MVIFILVAPFFFSYPDLSYILIVYVCTYVIIVKGGREEIRIRTRVCGGGGDCVYVRTCVCMRACVCAIVCYARACVYVCMYVGAGVCACVCVNVCVCERF